MGLRGEDPTAMPPDQGKDRLLNGHRPVQGVQPLDQKSGRPALGDYDQDPLQRWTFGNGSGRPALMGDHHQVVAGLPRPCPQGQLLKAVLVFTRPSTMTGLRGSYVPNKSQRLSPASEERIPSTL